MQVEIQRKGHARETLTDPTFEQCFNPEGEMQCTFFNVHAISLPVTSPGSEVARIVHLTDTDNKAKVDYGFAHAAGEFGQHLPEVFTRGDGGGAVLLAGSSHATSNMKYVAGRTYFNLRSNAPSSGTPHAQFACDGH